MLSGVLCLLMVDYPYSQFDKIIKNDVRPTIQYKKLIKTL